MKAKQRGASMVEFAIILPGFLLLMCLMIYGGMWMYAQNTLNEIARNAVRYGAVEESSKSEEEESDTIRINNVKKVAKEAAKESLILYSIDKDNMGVEVKLVKVISDNDSIQVERKAGLMEDDLPPLIDGFLPEQISSKMVMRIEK